MTPDPFAYVREWHARLQQRGWWHSFELPDGSTIQGVSDLAALKMRIAQFPIPLDLSGKRVLDVGAWDGWFSFEMERRGAEVVAIDRFDNPRFREIRSLLSSRVEYRVMDIYDVGPRTLGCFDIVLFLGVFYHLKHPLLALERVCSVTRDMAAVESYVLAEAAGNQLQFFEDDEFGGQVDNWFAPATPALQALCRTAGFARAELANRHAYGAAITCYRHWDRAPGDAWPTLRLIAAVNADNYGINFRSDKDDYLTCTLETPAVPVTRDTAFPQVGPYGIRPVLIAPLDAAHTVIHFKLPPGLAPGWHEVRIGDSNPLRIAVDIEAATDHVAISGACDAFTWRPEVSSGYLSLWAEGLPENADIANVRVMLGGVRQTVTFVGPAAVNGARQLNARVSVAPGAHRVRLECGAVRSQELEVLVGQASGLS
jgi:tRNA (mo5U34)-methyltransferase